MEKAAKEAIPNQREIKQLKSQLEKNKKELDKIKNAKNNLLDKVEKGIIEDEDLRERFQRHKEREYLLKSENETIQSKLSNFPTEQAIKLKAQLMLRAKESYFHTDWHLKEMNFDEKRALLQNIFSGTDKDGKRSGVYVEKKWKNSWLYTLRGNFIEQVGRVQVKSRKIKQNMHTKRHAYHGVRFHK
jgi:hypothetical protein